MYVHMYSHQNTNSVPYIYNTHVGLKSSASSMGGRERRAGLLEADLVRLGTAASLELVVFLALCEEEEA